MALKQNSSSPLAHLLIRLLGLTGVVAAAVGLFLWLDLGSLYGGPAAVVCGVIAVGIAILFEIKNRRQTHDELSSRRGAFGLNVFAQILLAIAVLAVVNAVSFSHYRRFDWTREHIFTLPQYIVDQLKQLRGTTDIIVYQKYVSFGQRTDNPQDEYDLAAQRKIVEKVKDLAEQFQDLGPRFRVTVLDVKNYTYRDSERKKRSRLDDATKDFPELKEAIEKAPENSIFFVDRSRKRIQRLSFSDIYQLDKQDSIEAGNGDGNLVLKFQGVGGFARKVFNIEEKKPRVALAIVHPVLGFQNKVHPLFTMSAAKKVLDAYGFQCTDIVLRKIDTEGDLTNDATAMSYDESRYEEIEDELADTNDSIRRMEAQQEEAKNGYRLWADSSLAQLNEKFIYAYLEDGRQGVMTRKQADNLKKTGLRFKLVPVDEDDRKAHTNSYKYELGILEDLLKADRVNRDSLIKEKGTLQVDRLAEKRRISDVEAKMNDMLANVDLLIVPRITTLRGGMRVSNRAHKLELAQLKALKMFMRQGKPVLFLLGASNEPSDMPDFEAPDQLESVLAEIGFSLPKETILYNVESKEFSQRKAGTFSSRDEVEVPGLRFDNKTTIGLRGKYQAELHSHPVRTSLTVVSRAAGKPDNKPESYDVRIRSPRPVYFMKSQIKPEAVAAFVGNLAQPGLAGRMQAPVVWTRQTMPKPDEGATLFVTSEGSWNESKPFLSKNHVPRYVPPKEDDPKKGNVEEPRRGPFPVAAAAEVLIPASWYDKDDASFRKDRVAVIGSGGIFVGSETLPPMNEKILLDVADWLLGRDDLLAKDVNPWEYPRVHMSEAAFKLWEKAARFGFSVFFIVVGIVVWLVRHVR